MKTNALGQPVGEPVAGWKAVPPPPRADLDGRWCRLEPLDPVRHADDLHAANGHDPVGRMWTYMGYGPFASEAEYRAWTESVAGGDDPLFMSILDKADGKAAGVASYLRVQRKAGVVEVGHIAYSPRLQRTRAATEAMYLMMARVFDALGYRRYEWKCDALNAASRKAAERLGFVYEGTFRQALVYKGRNRDTAWYAVVDKDWPALKSAFEAWLARENFDADGRQCRSLESFR